MAAGIGVATARRHVAEAEQHIADQRNIIEHLERNRHSAQAAIARRVLSTLENSLRLAQEHLAREEQKVGAAVQR